MGNVGERALRAAKYGEAQALAEALAASAEAANAVDPQGCTPLYWAARNGHAKCVDVLLRAGADKEAGDKGGWTPLHVSAANGRTECVEQLLAAGALVDARDKYGNTPLSHAASNGRLASIHALLRAGSNKDAQDESGWTPLHCAARWDHRECAAFLVRAGADTGVQTTRPWFNYPAGVMPVDVAYSETVRRTLERALVRVQIAPLLAGAARGQIFAARLYDPALWRLVARFVAPRE